MKNKKRMMSLLLVAVLCLGMLTACGGDKDNEKNDTTPAPTSTDVGTGGDETGDKDSGDEEQPSADALPPMTTENIKLTYMHFDNELLVNAVAEAFMKEYPNITVEPQAYVADGEYNNTLFNLVSAGQTPDCFMILGNCDFALSNALLGDMTEYWENDPENKNILPTINSAKLGYYGTDKKLASPIKFFPDAIYCDLNVFDTLNISAPSPEWTWEEMVQAFKDATNPTAGTYGFNQFHSIVTYYPVNKNAEAIGEFGWDGTSFNMADWAEGVNLWSELVNGKFHAPYFDTDENEAWLGDRTMWAGFSGKVGFQIDAWWTYLNLFDTPEYRDRGMEWVPYTTPLNSDGASFGVLDFGGIATNTDYPREAYELLKWMGWGVDGWNAKLEAYKTLTDDFGTPIYRMSMPCPITTDEGIWKEFQESFFPTANARTYQSVYDPVNGVDLVTAEKDEKYGEYFDVFFKNCKKVIPFGDVQIPGFLDFLETSYFAVGDTLGVEDQVRVQGKNANDFVDDLNSKANAANRAALDSARDAYSYLDIELNY